MWLIEAFGLHGPTMTWSECSIAPDFCVLHCSITFFLETRAWQHVAKVAFCSENMYGPIPTSFVAGVLDGCSRARDAAVFAPKFDPPHKKISTKPNLQNQMTCFYVVYGTLCDGNLGFSGNAIWNRFWRENVEKGRNAGSTCTHVCTCVQMRAKSIGE